MHLLKKLLWVLPYGLRAHSSHFFFCCFLSLSTVHLTGFFASLCLSIPSPCIYEGKKTSTTACLCVLLPAEWPSPILPAKPSLIIINSKTQTFSHVFLPIAVLASHFCNYFSTYLISQVWIVPATRCDCETKGLLKCSKDQSLCHFLLGESWCFCNSIFSAKHVWCKWLDFQKFKTFH